MYIEQLDIRKLYFRTAASLDKGTSSQGKSVKCAHTDKNVLTSPVDTDILSVFSFRDFAAGAM